jgi:hypothetical protein
MRYENDNALVNSVRGGGVQKGLYTFESVYKFIQMTYAVF